MRVFIIAQYFPPDMGGGATRAYNVAEKLGMSGRRFVENNLSIEKTGMKMKKLFETLT